MAAQCSGALFPGMRHLRDPEAPLAVLTCSQGWARACSAHATRRSSPQCCPIPRDGDGRVSPSRSGTSHSAALFSSAGGDGAQHDIVGESGPSCCLTRPYGSGPHRSGPEVNRSHSMETRVGFALVPPLWGWEGGGRGGEGNIFGPHLSVDGPPDPPRVGGRAGRRRKLLSHALSDPGGQARRRHGLGDKHPAALQRTWCLWAHISVGDLGPLIHAPTTSIYDFIGKW